ncbi:hypothetical protein Hanom_Chr16g01478121 [Helianthus anomalus]
MQMVVFSTYLENVAHLAGRKIKQVVPFRLEMPWRTNHNKIDCGVFMMRHMETYKGTTKKSWECGLSNECTDAGEISYKQRKELDDLRHKYVAKMVLSDTNTLRTFVEADVACYKKLTDDQKRVLCCTQ